MEASTPYVLFETEQILKLSIGMKDCNNVAGSVFATRCKNGTLPTLLQNSKNIMYILTFVLQNQLHVFIANLVDGITLIMRSTRYGSCETQVTIKDLEDL